MKSLLILGRQPALGLAELESLYGHDALTPLRSGAALMDIEPSDIDFGRLGGSVKLAKILTILNTNSWRDIEDYLTSTIAEHLQYLPEGKVRLGLSAYGLRVRSQEINATGLRLKKIIKAEGRSVRIVPNKSIALNSAQVLHNQLIGPTGWELVCVRRDNQTILAQTIAEQDIEAYAARDQARPARDAKVGMLPPKLAQIIINLTSAKADARILDPFCGTGVVLQESALIGLWVYGTDIDERMIRYSRDNLQWLMTNQHISFDWHLEVGDATSHRWQDTDIVAGETYLGRPLSSLPPQQVLDKIMAECDEIHEKFLRNIGPQLKSGTRLCLAVPAWHTKNGFLHLKTLAKLESLGYNRQKFVHTREQDLIYFREDQVVARELVVLQKQ